MAWSCRSRSVRRSMIAAVTALACATEPTETYTASVNTFSGGAPVATFVFTQTAQGSSSRTDLKVTNIWGQPLCVSFVAGFALNLASWQYPGSVMNLAPGGTATFSRISTNPARIDLGQIVVLFQTPPTTTC